MCGKKLVAISKTIAFCLFEFHVAVVKDVNRIYYYLDGEQVGSQAFNDVISDCDDHFQLGRWIEGGLKVVDGNTKQIKL